MRRVCHAARPLLLYVSLALLAVAGAGVQLAAADPQEPPAGPPEALSRGCWQRSVGGGTVEVCSPLLLPKDKLEQQQQQQEEVLAADSGAGGLNVPAGWDDTDIDLTEVWQLHSRPGAAKTIYLAFRGCSTENTIWNQPGMSDGENGTSPIITPPFDSDDPPTPRELSQKEMRDIIDIWRAVAEIFAVFDVDITTEEPLQSKLDREFDGDEEYGIRVCIGGDASWRLPEDRGSVAASIKNSFGRINPVDSPSEVWQDMFIFPPQLLPQLNRVWVIIAQNLGITLGLDQQQLCRRDDLGNKYYRKDDFFVGTGTWAPIMNEFLTLSYFNQWSNGTYFSGAEARTKEACKNQDQIKVIARNLPLLADETPSDSPDRALPLCIESSCTVGDTGAVSTAVNAVCNSGTDVDGYSFYAKAPGRVTILIRYVPNWGRSPFIYRRGTLRLKMTFTDPSVKIADFSETGPLAIQQNFTADIPAAGIYTFLLAPTVEVAARTSNWLPTNYGNVGDYTLRVTFPPGMSTFDGSTSPSGDVFGLHSRPSATRKIFLAFNGCQSMGAAWSKVLSPLTVPASLTSPPYDTDGSPGVFSASERADIAAIHAAVAEDFSPWDVDVTTEDPGVEGIDRADASDVNYGIRVCIGGNGSDWLTDLAAASLPLPAGATTLAVEGSFGALSSSQVSGQQLTYDDVIVWSQQLSPRVDKIWGAVSKGVGRSMGLPELKLCQELEDGTRDDIDFPGTPAGWGAIMGDVTGDEAASQFTQWSNGSTPSWPPPCNKVDEMAAITKVLPRLRDVEGSNADSGIRLCTDTPCQSVADPSGTPMVRTTYTGLASVGNDKDYFSFIVGAKGTARVVVTYTPNWYQASSAGGSFLFRKSNLRLVLGLDDFTIGLLKDGAFESVYDIQQSYTMDIPQGGIFSFWVVPQVSVGPNQALPTNYGNTGSYTITITWPGTSDTPRCGDLTNCNPSFLCLGCKSTFQCRCSCAATEGFRAISRAGKPSCVYALAWDFALNAATVGYFRARPGRLLRLPWRLSTRGCPLVDQRVLRSDDAGLELGARTVPCPDPASTGIQPRTLALAAAKEVLGQQSCKAGAGYTVWRVPDGVAASATPVCRRLTIRTTDDRQFSALVWVG